MKTMNLMIAVAAGAVLAHADLPVKEVTVFKDDHAFVLQEGMAAADASGDVRLDHVPSPVLGTFWPYAADDHATLRSVTSGKEKWPAPRTALSVRDLVEANTGSRVIITEISLTNYPATIIGIPRESEGELPKDGAVRTPQKSAYVLLKTDAGTKAVSLDRILDLTLPDACRTILTNEETRTTLTLHLDWKGKPAAQANIGMIYLQRGIRWIPQYKVSIDGAGKAVVKLQASIINELIDLSNATVHLAVGVPTFDFKDQVDPISLQQTAVQLSQHFRPDARSAYGFANSVMTQVSMPMERSEPAETGAGAATMDLGPDVAASGSREDLFVFTLEHITLRKGERMVVPVSECTVAYTDVYTLNVPVAPPQEVWRNIDRGRQDEITRQMLAAKVLHKIRLANSSAQPFTTAPALIMKGDAPVAQGLMTYTSPGGACDLPLTTTVNVNVKKSDREVRRTPNAYVWDHNNFARIDMSGTLTLVNYGGKPVQVEVTRNVIGVIDKAGAEAAIDSLSQFEDASYGAPEQGTWWSWYSWPWWCWHVNGVSRAKWSVTLEPKKPCELTYEWHYFWE